MNYERLLHLTEILSKLKKKQLHKLVKNYQKYCELHKKKPELIHNFVECWHESNLEDLKEYMEQTKYLVEVNNEIIQIEEKIDEECIMELSRALDDKEIALIRADLIKLFQVFEKVKIQVKKQLDFFDKAGDNPWYEFNYKEELIESLNEEARLLFDSNLSKEGDNGRDLIIELNNEIEQKIITVNNFRESLESPNYTLRKRLNLLRKFSEKDGDFNSFVNNGVFDYSSIVRGYGKNNCLKF
ncbi:MAG: hypothetical protein U9O94_02420 [Nanoarchaeota archaeon]|nr:hypothetical protein [Nanoarchaeota archaeon]